MKQSIQFNNFVRHRIDYILSAPHIFFIFPMHFKYSITLCRYVVYTSLTFGMVFEFVCLFFLSWINYIRAVCWTYLLHYKRTLTIASILGIIVKKLHCTQHGGGSTVYYNAPSVNESSIQMCLMRKSVTGGLLSFVFERFSDVLVMCFFFCSFQFAFFCLFGRVSEMGACFLLLLCLSLVDCQNEM